MEEFKKLGLSEPILRVIKEEGFKEPSEIQRKTIPLVLSGRDVIGGSATGSGKTLAFVSGIIQKSKNEGGIQALILTPTRELADQIAKSLKMFSKYRPLKTAVLVGGLSITPQIEKLRTADVVVATPGRTLDHIERRTIDLRGVKTLILDEADRMLDMGFIDDVERIIRSCPRNRQTLLFSATISDDINRLSRKYMNNPVMVSAIAHVDPKKLAQVYYDVLDNMKFSLLVHLLKHEKSKLVMVFCNTRENVDFVAMNLKANGIESMAIHGGFSQEKRNKTMDTFHSKNTHVLVCTDVAARGLDIKDVSHVYNYDIPKNSKEYIHRIGRTARAGKEGMAVNIVAPRDHSNFNNVLKDNAIDVKMEETPYVNRVRIIKTERRDRWDHRRSFRR